MGLAALLAGSVAATARAQAPSYGPYPPSQPVVHKMCEPPQALTPFAAQPGTAGTVPPGTPQAAAGKRPCLNCFNRIGSGCYTTRNDTGCTSCYAEYIFFFGTCRQFFAEPCLPPPPGSHPCLEWMARCLTGGAGSNNGANNGGNGGCSKCGDW
jgi:hypothetical protein